MPIERNFFQDLVEHVASPEPGLERIFVQTELLQLQRELLWLQIDMSNLQLEMLRFGLELLSSRRYDTALCDIIRRLVENVRGRLDGGSVFNITRDPQSHNP
jgi:hypothetical protein